MSGLRSWLEEADRVFGDPESPEEQVDSVLATGLLDETIMLPGSAGATQVDPAALQRVIAALTARRAAVAVELADLARRRVELSRQQRGVSGYATVNHYRV